MHLPSLAATTPPAILPPLTNQLNQQHYPHTRSPHYSSQRTFATCLHPSPPSIQSTTDLTLSGPLRRGKWTRPEEDYAAATISYFCDGLLAIQYGTTLRGYLAQQLHCDPMRISKKLLPGSVFAGIKINPKIGRRAYYPCAQDSPAASRSKENAARHLTRLRELFIHSIEEEDQTLEAAGDASVKDSPTCASETRPATPRSPKSITRKRSFEDINSVVRAAQQQQQGQPPSLELTEPPIFYHYDRPAQPPGPSSQYAVGTMSPRLSPRGINKLPKLTVLDDVSRRASYSAQHRSVSPVTVATSNAILPPLHVSLVRASMC